MIDQPFEQAGKPDIQYTIDLMTKLHEGQTDHSGEPYYLHPLRVAANAKKIMPSLSNEEVMGILLHDTIEDCDEVEDEQFFLDRGYTEETTTVTVLMTKPENDTRSYDEVIDELIASGNVGAIVGKIGDNMDNLHPERVAALRAIDPEKADRLETKYKKSIVKLCHAVNIDPDWVLGLIKDESPQLEHPVSLDAA